jgi:hypothetical protein
VQIFINKISTNSLSFIITTTQESIMGFVSLIDEGIEKRMKSIENSTTGSIRACNSAVAIRFRAEGCRIKNQLSNLF